MGQPLDQSGSSNTDASGSFQHHQEGTFNLGRQTVGGSSAGAGGAGGPSGGGGVAAGPHQANFVGGMNTYMSPSSGPGAGHHHHHHHHNHQQQQQQQHMNPHGMHGSPYPRNESQHHQHSPQSHYQSHVNTATPRGGGGGGGGGGSNAGGGGSGNANAGHGGRGVGVGGDGTSCSHNHHNPSFPPINATNPLMTGGPHLTPQGTVMMVYGLGLDRINCDRLFNLFCLYGNVVRVKFLRSKEGCAMVQMGDVIAVDRCVSSLNKITLFGNEMQISYSKQPYLHVVMQPYTLPDGSPSFKDFMVNKNNRFRNPEVASKNKISPPSRVLHFFNAPFGISDEELTIIFKQTAGHEPVSLKIFTPKVESARSFSGLVTFRDPTEATEALVLCNHLSLPKAGAPHPYILRLCFSSPAY